MRLDPMLPLLEVEQVGDVGSSRAGRGSLRAHRSRRIPNQAPGCGPGAGDYSHCVLTISSGPDVTLAGVQTVPCLEPDCSGALCGQPGEVAPT